MVDAVAGRNHQSSPLTWLWFLFT